MLCSFFPLVEILLSHLIMLDYSTYNSRSLLISQELNLYHKISTIIYIALLAKADTFLAFVSPQENEKQLKILTYYTRSSLIVSIYNSSPENASPRSNVPIHLTEKFCKVGASSWPFWAITLTVVLISALQTN